MTLRVIDHPICNHVLSLLRDRRTSPAAFRTCSRKVTTILALEATRDLPTREIDIVTPLEETRGAQIAVSVVVVVVLRAGMSMVDPLVDLIPNVSVGFVGMQRNEVTAKARSYYCKLPSLEGKRILIVDPMLATGGSARHAILTVYKSGGTDVNFLNIVAAPEGVKLLDKEFPDLKIYTGAIDRKLNQQKYILPGLGDFGDRLYGT